MMRLEEQTGGPFTRFGRFLRFGVLGAVGFGINIAGSVVLTGFFGVSEELSFAIALTAILPGVWPCPMA
jgi:putative flippase GtrA